MTPFLVQRAKFENRDHKSGIDSIIRLSYMGSSEFEWGAVPHSLTRIRTNASEYVYLAFNIKGKNVTVYCKKSQENLVEKYLKDLAENKVYLKEYSDFNNYVNLNSLSKCYTDFWWDIENDLMFWKNDNDFMSKFVKVI